MTRILTNFVYTAYCQEEGAVYPVYSPEVNDNTQHERDKG